MEISTLLYVAIGGSCGAVLRYLVGNLGQTGTTSAFPLGTLVVNILGYAAIGILTALLVGSQSHHREIFRLVLVVGVLGGFTTYSSFAMDSIELFDDGRGGQAVLYVTLTNLLGIGAALLCYRAGTMIFDGSSA